ncbi:MauE/DoxX family redox-associated membrane protein [Aeromicrobium sp.]|uniref:DoxX family protein n=1 Tax=Aeromicrobium sp. TaxID=1871063 RepID=UPI0019B58081|nr:MauE/DoxX family redox-associated membrane protein [Aeromicrobium sp.]MBC7633129.1 DoxX family protein [Aeromicrobium sp.]
MNRDITFLAALFTVSGVGHFVRPEPFESIVPKPLPYKRELVYASGAVEIVCAAMMLHPRTRRLGGLASAGLLLAVLPANVQMTVSAMRSEKTPGWFKAGTVARLPLQLPMIRTAMKAART